MESDGTAMKVEHPAVAGLKQQIRVHADAAFWHRNRVKFAKDQLKKLKKALAA
jgi:hypothetical protein